MQGPPSPHNPRTCTCPCTTRAPMLRSLTQEPTSGCLTLLPFGKSSGSAVPTRGRPLRSGMCCSGRGGAATNKGVSQAPAAERNAATSQLGQAGHRRTSSGGAKGRSRCSTRCASGPSSLSRVSNLRGGGGGEGEGEGRRHGAVSTVHDDNPQAARPGRLQSSALTSGGRAARRCRPRCRAGRAGGLSRRRPPLAPRCRKTLGAARQRCGAGRSGCCPAARGARR